MAGLALQSEVSAAVVLCVWLACEPGADTAGSMGLAQHNRPPHWTDKFQDREGKGDFAEGKGLGKGIEEPQGVRLRIGWAAMDGPQGLLIVGKNFE